MPDNLGCIYAIPLVLAAVSTLGLIAALLTDGPLDALWTAAIAVPILVIGWKLLCARKIQ